MRRVAIRLIDRLASEGLWSDASIYVRNDRYASERPSATAEPIRTRRKSEYYVEHGVDVLKIAERADPKTLTIVFEGPLYERLNHAPDGPDFLYGLSERYLHDYGLYLDMLNPFTAAAYRI